MEIINSLPRKLSVVQDIEEINQKIGSTDISEIGDGTITGAIASQNEAFAKSIDEINTDLWHIKRVDFNVELVAGSETTVNLLSYFPEGATPVSVIYQGAYPLTDWQNAIVSPTARQTLYAPRFTTLKSQSYKMFFDLVYTL